MDINRFKIIDRCLYWEDKKILIVGDLHLGYEENLSRGGISIPKNQINETIKIFERIFAQVGKVKKIILLGDVKHYFAGILSQEFDDFKILLDLFEKQILSDGKIIIVKGNHDNILEPVIRNFENVELMESYFIEDVCFIHGDFLEFKDKDISLLLAKNKIDVLRHQKIINNKRKGSDGLSNFLQISDLINNKKINTIVIGHFHPAIVLEDGAKKEKYKCFLYGKLREKKELIIVPSFFPLIEGSDIQREINWKIDISKFKVIALDEVGKVYDFGEVRKLKKS